MLVGCTNTPGGREWGACPHGFVGSSELSTLDSGCRFSQFDLNSSTAVVIPSVTLTLDNVQATMFSGPEHELVVFTGSLVDDLDAAMPLIFGRVSICCERDASQADAAMPLIFERVPRTTYRTVADSTVICCERDASQAEAAI